MSDIEAFDMTAVRKKWAEKEALQDTTTRKVKRRNVENSVDKRSMRATGRVVQYNLRVRDGWKDEVVQHAQQCGFRTAIEFLEAAVQAYVDGKGKGNGRA
jgi:hypothetical protein